MGLKIEQPVVVAELEDLKVLTEGAKLGDIEALAQTYDDDNGYGEVIKLQVLMKFMYFLDDVDPPREWEDKDG